MLRIEASNGVSACKGFHYYLKNYCQAHLSWDGYRLPDLLEFPAAYIEMQSSSSIIYYQNVCTHSYSFTWWSWSEWRKHIDWIALSGITLTLAPFQEDVWSEVYSDYGLSQDHIDEHLSGPGFFAWQRMGNIRGWGGKLSPSYITFASEIQRMAINSLNDLGISVAVPAFAGHLPVQFREVFPNANFSVVERWNSFPDKYCCPLFLDPIDPLFQEIGAKFLQTFTKKYGTNHIYFSDPFNEVQPRLAEAEYLKDVSNSIYSAMKSVDDKAIWLLQGWMLVKNPLWTDHLIESFLTAVPKGRMLVLDLQSEQHPQYNRTNSFYGQPFVWCMLHNFGGTLGMHGSIRYINEEIPRAANMENSTMLGVGITPEGIHQNYVVYEFTLEKAWLYKEINHKKWIKNYATNRYGFKSDEIEHAWLLLLKSVFAFEGLQNIRGKYTICRRPSLRLQPWKWYDEKYVKKALKRFVAVAANETTAVNGLFKRDLVDLTRQFLQNQADALYVKLVEAYKQKKIEELVSYASSFISLLTDLDMLLGSHEDFLVGKFLESAKQVAANYEEKQTFEFNARNQITLWGPTGQIIDYATKQWNGVVSDYYMERWNLFFAQLTSSLKNNTRFSQAKFQDDVFKNVELPFNLNRKIYPSQAEGDSIALAQKFYQRWSKLP